MAGTSPIQILLSFLLLSVYLICIVPSTTGQQQYGNCPELTMEDLGSSNRSSVGLIPQAVGGPAAILRYEVLCQSSGTVKGTFRSASVLLQYGSVDDPLVDSFGFVCNVSGEWILNPVTHFTEPPMFGIPARNDCSFCSLGRPIAGSYDSSTYCIACNSSCTGSGLCYGNENGTISECCNFYSSSSCVETCPDSTTPNSVFDCEPPRLTPSPNGTAKEGKMFTISCTPSDLDVVVRWSRLEFGDGREEFQPVAHGGNFEIPTNGHRLIIRSVGSRDSVFRCNVAGNSNIFHIIGIRVLLRCDVSLAAGLLWNTSFTGDIRSHRCNAVDSRFSNVVRVSRLCGPGIWSDVDFSNCTLTSYQDPFILLWLFVNTTANLDEALIISLITSSIESSGGLVVPSSASISLISLSAAIAGVPSTPHPSPGQILYCANLTNTSNIIIMNISGSIVEIFQVRVRNARILTENTSNSDSFVFEASSECRCLSYLQPTSAASIGEGGSEGTSNTNDIPLSLCVGGIISPCACLVLSADAFSNQSAGEALTIVIEIHCNCNQFYTGDGFYCTADSDGDTYPDKALSNCSSMNQSSLPVYCFTDTCPTIYNLPQSDTAPCTPSTSAGTQCSREVDLTYGFQWGYTQAGTTVNQFCGSNFVGNATRVCYSNGTWAKPNPANCLGAAYVRASEQSVALGSLETASLETVLSIQDTMTTLVEATAPSPNGTSDLPLNLQVTATYLRTVVNYYTRALGEGLTDVVLATTVDTESILDILSNVISTNNLPGAAQLAQVDPEETFAQDILETAELYGLFLATYLDLLADIGGINTTILAAENILMNPSVIDVNEQLEDVIFPVNTSSIANVSGAVLNRLEEASINIPSSFIRLRAEENGVNRVRVSNVIFQNLDMFLSSNIENATQDPVTLVLSTQIQQRLGNPNGILATPINLTFVALDQNSTQISNYTCVFWDFSLRNGLGSWSTAGVTTTRVADSGNNQTTIQCSSNHLTSFSVLVSVAGANVNTKSLEIVSYIGLGLSLVCLLATIIFFLSFGKMLLTAVHNFIHLNLAIALFLAYLTFTLGIELAAKNKVACHVVAALLHYLFLAVFSWMLCEGVMLYLMLVVVFSDLSKKWWFFFLLGWLPPVLFVIIGLAVDVKQYAVYDENNLLKFCWLASGGKNFAIWFFVAPMIAIIIINAVFLIMVLVSLVRSIRTKQNVQDKGGKRIDIIKSTIKASVILLPLLGLTWIIGLFAVSQNTLAFAWIFAILNTLQGVFIFFFHVLRHERVWGQFKKKYHLFESTLKTGHSSANSYKKQNIRNKSGTGSTAFSESLNNNSGKLGEEKIPLDEYKQTSADEAKPSGRVGSEENLLPEEIEISDAPYEESIPANNTTANDKDEKVPLDHLPVEPESHAIDLPESTLENDINEDGLIFDEDDEQYPTFFLRLQSVKYKRQNTNINSGD